jgi:2-polyprenyl-6-methoxyphenol hydroxylase-like FAD-dependent oxidoreductase
MPGAPRILIVGAGPTGLTAAVELARQGIIAKVIDRQDGPSQLSKAVGIMPASIRHLTASGAAEASRREAVVADIVIIH